MNQAMSAWQSFGQPQQNTAKNNPYMAQPQQPQQQTGYRPQSNMSGTGYAPSKAATNYNTGAWGAGPQQTTAPQQPAQAAIPPQQTTTQQGWTTGTSIAPGVQQTVSQQPANNMWGGGKQAITWAAQLQSLKKQMDDAQRGIGQMTRVDAAAGPRRQFVDVDRNKQRYDSYKAEYDALQQKMQRYLQDQYKNVYGGDQSAMAGAMNNFWGDNSNVLTRSRSLPTPAGGFKVGDRVSYQVPMYSELSQQGQADMYRQEYGDEYGYIQDMLKQMWGG